MNLLTNLTATEWLLLGLSCVLLLCLIGIAIWHMMGSEVDDTNEPAYRTADAKAIARQTKRIIASAAAHTSAPQRLDRDNLETARREGAAAAIHDMGQKPGTPPTANPHASDTLAHFTWRKAYQHTSSAPAQRGAA